MQIINGPTIAAGEALSGVVDCSAMGRVIAIGMPMEWTPALLTFQASVDGVEFRDVFDREAKEVAVNIAAGTMFRLAEDYEFPYVRVRSGSRLNPIAQADDRQFVILFDDAAGTTPTPAPKPDWLEGAYIELTADQFVQSFSAALIVGPELDFDGETVCVIQFFTPGLEVGSNSTAVLSIEDNGNKRGSLGTMSAKNEIMLMPIFAARRMIPDAGKHTFVLAAHRSEGTADVIVHAGAGGETSFLPAYMRIIMLKPGTYTESKWP